MLTIGNLACVTNSVTVGLSTQKQHLVLLDVQRREKLASFVPVDSRIWKTNLQLELFVWLK